MPLTSALTTALTAALSAEDPREGLQVALDAVRKVDVSGFDAASRALVEATLASLRARTEEREQLRVDRERLDLLSQASFEGLFFHVGGDIFFANARVAELLGRTVEEFLEPNALRRDVAPEDVDRVLEHMASGRDDCYVITCVRKDGTRFLAELQAKQGTLGERPIRVVAVRDVTERELQANKLRESEARMRGLAEEAFDMIAISRDGIVLDVGGRTQQLLARAPEQIIGRPILEFVAPSVQVMTRQALLEQRAGPFESLLLAADGELVPAEIVAAHATFQGQPVRLTGLRDLREAKRAEAERHRLQARIERGQRLQALGVLAGGVAHDFNNLLQGIIGNAALLEGDALTEEQCTTVDAIKTAGRRAAELTRQLLAYAGHRSIPVSEPVDVGALLRELQRVLSARLSTTAELRLDIGPSTMVLGDSATLSQVLMNLLTNASDALEGQPGRIDVGVRTLDHPDERWDDALGATVGPGRWVEVTVRDDGVGMDAATRARIFEPFFTTKATGHGLGLAGCLGILTAHGGAVLVETTPGHGSTFSVLLPASDRAPSSDPPEVPGIEPCRVLLVDDEALVLGQLERLLARRGFQIETATSGEAALERLPGVQPELIIMDFKMGGMSGLEVAQHIRDAGHDTPILLMSGYYDADAERLIELGVIQAFLPKPYDLQALAAAIARARASR